MKNIDFHKVEMENYCGYVDPMEFTFENSKITLISGKNGVGKSTVFGAIPFALYGTTQTGQTAIDVLNNKTERNCLVKCYFSIDSVKYKAVRGIKSPKAAVSAALFIEGQKDPIAKGAREVTNKIEELIVPKDLFLNTILFGQKVKSFFTDLPDSKQKEIFRKILQLDAYVDYQKKASDRIHQLDTDMVDTERIIDKIDASIDSFNFNIEKIHDEIKEKEDRCDELVSFIESLKDKKQNQEKHLESLNEERENDQLTLLLDRKNNLNNELENLKVLQSSKMSELSAQVISKIAQLKEFHSTEVAKCNDFMNKEISGIKEKQNEGLTDINEKISKLRENYLTEKNDLSSSHNEKINEMNDLIQTKRDEIRDKKDLLKSEISETYASIDTQETKEINEEKEKFDTLKKGIETKINEAKIEIVSFEKDVLIQKNKVANSTDKIDHYTKAIALKATICPTCQQPWDDVSHIEKSIEVEKALLLDYLAVEKSIQVSIADVKKQIGSYEKDLEKELVKLDSVKNDICRGISIIKKKTSDKYEKIEKQQEVDSEEILLDCTMKKKAIEKAYEISLKDLDDKFVKLANEQEQIKISVEYGFKEVIEKIESENKNQLDDLDNRLSIAIGSVNAKEKENELLICKEFADKTKDLNNKIYEFDNHITEVKHKIAVIEGQKNQIQKTDEEIKYMDNELVQTRKDVNTKCETIQETKDIIKQKVVHKKESQNIIKDSKEKQKICQFWKGGFSSAGIPSMLIDESIPFMNKRISSYLEQMSNGRYIVTFDTLHETKKGEFRDKISVNVYDVETHSNSRVGLSGGQTKLVDIATILTLSDLQENVQKFKTNILLFDEIFDALDDDNIANVSNMLRRIIRDKSINIITHRHIDQVEADAIYNFGQ